MARARKGLTRSGREKRSRLKSSVDTVVRVDLWVLLTLITIFL